MMHRLVDCKAIFASDDQIRGDDEADARQTCAHHSAGAQKSRDGNVATNQESTAELEAADEQTSEEDNAAADAALQTAAYDNAATQFGNIAAAIDTPWTQFLAGAAGAAAAWWSTDLRVYLNYQDTVAGDQAAESTGAALAAQTEADAQADADHTLAYAQADAAHQQTIDDDAAQEAEQAADATDNRNYELGLAQAALDYQTALPDISAANSAQESDTTAADQNYLSDELAAEDTLTETTAGDALTDSTKVAQAQLNWTKSGDAATEGYLYSTSLATDQQSDLDAVATVNYQTTSSASYASAVQSFDQANPSPWADCAAAMASAQATQTYGVANAQATEQIALADAELAQSWADALAQQGLDDAQATAAANLSIGQQTAQSDLSMAQTVFANARAFQFSTSSGELPPQLTWGPLTAWSTLPDGSSTPRDGVTLPLAWTYQAGYDPAAGYEYYTYANSNSSNADNLWGSWWPSSATAEWNPAGSVWAPSDYVSEQEYMPNQIFTSELYTQLVPPVYLHGVQIYTDGDTVFSGVPWPETAVGGMPTESWRPSPPSVASPVPDDTAHQQPAFGANPSYSFGASPLSQLSDQALAAANTTPTAAAQVQQVQQKAAADAAASQQKVLQDAVQSQLLSVDYQNIPVKRIDAMVDDGLAFRYSKNPNLVYFASVIDNAIVIYVLSKVNSYSGAGTVAVRYEGSSYAVVSQSVTETDASPASVSEILAALNTQQRADYQIENGYLARVSTQNKQALLGTINFVVHSFPVSGTADHFVQGNYWEGTLSAAGDAAFFLSMGGSRVFRIGAAVFEGGVGAARAGQGIYALKQGESLKAAGYFGEAFLRFLGVSATAITEIKAAQAARAATAQLAQTTLKNLPVDEVATLTEKQAFALIDRFRSHASGLAPLGSRVPAKGDGLGTVALVQAGRKFFGVNSSLLSDSTKNLGREFFQLMKSKGLLGTASWYGQGAAQVLTHAEAIALMRAWKFNGGKLAADVTLFVDRYTCDTCATYLKEVMQVMGVKVLTIISKDGRKIVLQSSS